MLIPPPGPGPLYKTDGKLWRNTHAHYNCYKLELEIREKVKMAILRLLLEF